MKILQIIPGNVWGGAEQYILDLGTNLQSQGHNVKFVCNDVEAVKKRLEGVVPFTTLPKGGLYNLRRIKPLQQIIAEFKPDVIHTHNRKMVYAVSRAAKKAGSAAKIVLTYHDCHRNTPPFWQKKYFLRLHRMIFVSNFAYNRWHGSNLWMPQRLCSVVINSIKPGDKAEASENLRKKYGISADTPLVMFSGRVRKSKGCELILHALAKVKDLDWSMIFVGGYSPADYLRHLEKVAAEEGISDRVHFYGFSRDARALTMEADLCVAPSIMRDPCPLSPLESMQMGKCVIASDSGGQPEYVIDGKTGLIVATNDVDALADALRRILSEKSLRESIGAEAARYFQESLNYDNFTKKIVSIYQAD